MNSLSQTIPTELGQITAMTSNLYLQSNQLCDNVPTEVAALSSQFTSGWQVATGKELGTPCCETLPDVVTCNPTSSPTSRSQRNATLTHTPTHALLVAVESLLAVGSRKVKMLLLIQLAWVPIAFKN